MTIKTVTIGTAVDVYRYDDSISVEGLGGTPTHSIIVQQPIKTVAPIDSDDAIRQGDVLSFTRGSKITADSVTISAGTSSDGVTDLRSHNDGNIYTITEGNGTTPGQTLIVDFVSVIEFSYVQILGTYEGSVTHAIEIEVYNWDTSNWDHLQSMQNSFSNSGTIFNDESIIVPDCSDYISSGQVRIRFNHPMVGNPGHSTYIDVVALY